MLGTWAANEIRRILRGQPITVWLVTPLLALARLPVSAQCDPGPAIGHAVNHCYDDGYVYVDSSGNAGGYTWYWGYQNGFQVQTNCIILHSTTNISATTVQLLADAYDYGTILLPLPPYEGTYSGFGPIIPDSPVSRTITVITRPFMSVASGPTNSLMLSWPSSAAGWKLQQSADLHGSNWTDVLTGVSDDGTNRSIAMSPSGSSQYYRLNLR